MSTKPDWYFADPSIGGLVVSWGYEVVASETFGSWQGDEAYILSDGERFGIVVIGYGSCSGCDAFEAATPYSHQQDGGDWSDMDALREEWRNAVRWFDSTVDAVVALDLAPSSGSDWWIYDKEVLGWLRDNLPDTAEEGIA